MQMDAAAAMMIVAFVLARINPLVSGSRNCWRESRTYDDGADSVGAKA
jgi:hypothetical protein